MPDRRERIENALWGLFAGDALAMPAHWFYSLDNIQETFSGGVDRYLAAPHPHPESFMVGMSYHPDVAKATRLGRQYDILHEHARFYDTSYSRLTIQTDERESEHGNATPKLEDRYHYHHGLNAGENTTGAQLVRVLLRSVIAAGRYDENRFLTEFVRFLTTSGNNSDPYTEIYLRSWFERYSRGLEPTACAARQRDVWSIGSHGGMIRPLVVAMLAPTPFQAIGFAAEHQALTHRSENVTSALSVAVPILHDLLDGCDPGQTVISGSRSLRVPKVTGEELFRLYREHDGPGNISPDQMWHLHVDFEDGPFNLKCMVEVNTEEDVVLKKFATACYPEHGLPLLLFLLAKHQFDVQSALLANANAGGDNVHRGMIMGILAGAAQVRFPEHLKSGLAEHAELAREISGFAEIAASGTL